MKIKWPLACYFSVKLPEGGGEIPPAEKGQVLKFINIEKKRKEK